MISDDVVTIPKMDLFSEPSMAIEETKQEETDSFIKASSLPSRSQSPVRAFEQTVAPEESQLSRKRSMSAPEGEPEVKRAKTASSPELTVAGPSTNHDSPTERRDGSSRVLAASGSRALVDIDEDVKPPQPKASKHHVARKRRKEDEGRHVKKRRRVVFSSDEESDEEDARSVSKPKVQERAKQQASEKVKEQTKENKCERQKHSTSGSKKAGKRVKPKEDEGSDDDDDRRTFAAKKAAKTSCTKADSSGSSHKQQASSKQKRREPSPSLIASLPLPLSEMQGMLIEALASSRASSLPASSLYNSLVAARPTLKEAPSTKRDGPMDKREWMSKIEDVLEAGRVWCGVFEKVESRGKVSSASYVRTYINLPSHCLYQDTADHTLEAQWFYVPENDEDQERAMLIRSMMPRPAKRTETKKSKQYYWRPLGKISRWDPEDDL